MQHSPVFKITVRSPKTSAQLPPVTACSSYWEWLLSLIHIFCREPLEKFRGFCKEFGLNPAELCMSFLLSIPGVTSLVLGSETAKQVEDNAALVNNTKTFTAAEMERFHAAFADIDPRVTNPGMWFNNKGNDGGQKKV